MIPRKTPISYYGGKQKMADKILRLIPAHRNYVEPFFGGGSIFFAKGKSHLEVINDINRNVINFFEVMKSRFDELNEEIEFSLFSEELHKRAYRIYKHPKGYSKVKRAWAFWMVTNNSFRSKIGGGWKWDNATDGSHHGVINRNKARLFKYYFGRMQDVQISCKDALTVIKQRDTVDTFFYLDPPYPNADQGHYRGYKVSDLMNLVELLSEITGKFILSNYALQELLEFAIKQNWNILKYDMRLLSMPKRIARKTEVLITNYEIANTLF